MNQAFLDGYISTKYAETRTTASGKSFTSFSLSCPKKGKDGAKEYEHFKCECWHDEYGTQNGIVDGKYVKLECIPRAWKTDKASGVSFTVKRIWHAPEREGSAVMDAVNQAASNQSNYEQPALEADSYEDIPF